MKTYTTTGKPIEFAIDGEAFSAFPMPGTALLAYAENIGPDGTVKLTANGAALTAMFAKVMTAAEHERFRAYVDDPGHMVDAVLLAEILGDIIAESAGRPTLPPSGSPDGRPTTGPTSTVDSLLAAARTPNGFPQPVS